MSVLDNYRKFTYDTYFSCENRIELLTDFLIREFNRVAEVYRSMAENGQELSRIVAIHVPAEMVEDAREALIKTTEILQEIVQGNEPSDKAPAFNKTGGPTDAVVVAFVPTLTAIQIEGNANIPENMQDSDMPEEVTQAMENAMAGDPDPLEWTKYQYQLVDVNQVVGHMIDSLDESIGFSASLPIRLSLNDRKLILLTALATARMVEMFSNAKGQPAYSNDPGIMLAN